MTKRTVAAMACAVGVMGSAALAAGMTEDQQPGAMSHELIGRVTKAQPKMLYLESEDGAVIPLKIEHQTTLVGLTGDRIRELRRNDFLQVEYVEKGTQKVATRIELRTGMGGSGMFQVSVPGAVPGGPMSDPSNPQTDEAQKPAY